MKVGPGLREIRGTERRGPFLIRCEAQMVTSKRDNPSRQKKKERGKIGIRVSYRSLGIL